LEFFLIIVNMGKSIKKNVIKFLVFFLVSFRQRLNLSGPGIHLTKQEDIYLLFRKKKRNFTRTPLLCFIRLISDKFPLLSVRKKKLTPIGIAAVGSDLTAEPIARACSSCWANPPAWNTGYDICKEIEKSLIRGR